MNTVSQNSSQEITINDIKSSISLIIHKVKMSFFSLISFIVKKWIVLLVLFIFGFVLGYFMDNQKVYKQEIIVRPNFNSAEYLYKKMDELKSRINDKDSVFLKKYNLNNIHNIKKVKIVPLKNIYELIQSNSQNIEMIKLMAEDISINEIINENINEKTYPYHTITIITKQKISKENLINPILNYLNDSDYWNNIKKIAIENTQYRLRENDTTLIQLNGILNNLASQSSNAGKNTNLIYYNENNKLNDLFFTKEKIQTDKSAMQMDLINYERVITDVGHVENNTLRMVKFPMKFILPLFLFILYILGQSFINSYKKHKDSIR